VKRCAPGIGRVGEARVFCETGWMGNPPNDLIDLSNLAREHSESLPGHPSPIDDAQLRPPSYRSDMPTSSSPLAPTAPDLLDEQKNTGEIGEHQPYISPSRNTSRDSSQNPTPSDPRAQNQSSDSNIIPEYYSMNLAMGDNTHTPAVQAATIIQSGRRSLPSPGATSSSLLSPCNTSHSANKDNSSSGDNGNNNVVAQLREKFDDNRRSLNRQMEENSVLIPRNPEEGHRKVLHGKLPPRVVDHNLKALVPDATYQGPFRSSTSPYHSGVTFSTSAPYLPITGVAAYPSTLTSEISKPSWVGRGLRKLSLPMFSVSGNNTPRSSIPSPTNVRMPSSSYERELSNSVRGDIASSYRSTQGHS